MAKRARGNENCCTGGKFNGNLEIPQDEVAATCVVKVSQGGDGTPAKGKVVEIDVVVGARQWAEVEHGAGKYAFAKVAVEVGVAPIETAEAVDVVPVDSWCPHCKGG